MDRTTKKDQGGMVECPECDGWGHDWGSLVWDEESGDEWFQDACPRCLGEKVVPASDTEQTKP